MTNVQYNPASLGQPPPKDPRALREWARERQAARRRAEQTVDGWEVPSTSTHVLRVSLVDNVGEVIEFDEFSSAVEAEAYIDSFVHDVLFDSDLVSKRPWNVEPSGAVFTWAGERVTASWPFTITVERLDAPPTCLVCGGVGNHQPGCKA